MKTTYSAPRAFGGSVEITEDKALRKLVGHSQSVKPSCSCSGAATLL